MNDRPIIVASNRGPSMPRTDRPRGQARSGQGGLATAMAGALRGAGGLWIAAAMTDQERALHGRRSLAGMDYDVRYLSLEPRTYDRFYNGISNRVLWFLHHCLWDLPRAPSFDERTAADWAAFRSVNRVFADAVVDEADGTSGEPALLVQDYHLSLVPAMVRAARPRARVLHFSHTPFAGAGYVRVLPQAMRDELLAGLLGADVVGFQAEAWAANFLASCRLLPGARVDERRRVIRWEGRSVRVRVHPVAVDAGELRSAAASDAVARQRDAIRRWRGQDDLVVRVDRAELSKNVVRGFLAFERFLERRRDRRGTVRFLALLNPSRERLPEYRAYLQECGDTAERINRRFARAGHDPIRLSIGDHPDQSIAAFAEYDALMVNPVFDGMNLVAKEGPVVNERDGVLILSRNAGAHAELGRHAIAVDPFDVSGTAAAIEAALDMPAPERRRRARALRATITRRDPEQWVRAQVDDLAGVP